MKKFTVYFDEKCGEYKKKKTKGNNLCVFWRKFWWIQKKKRQRVTVYVYFDEKCSEYKKKKKNKTKVNIYQLVALAICFR